MSFRIDPSRSLTAEVRRVATGEIEAMLRHLASAPNNTDKAMHGCRKRIKRLRALLRLVRSGNPDFIAGENARYRDIAASLAGPREAAAMIETIDRLADAFPEHASAGAFKTIRSTLKAQRKHLLLEGKAHASLADSAAASCRAGLARIDALILPDDPEQAADILADGARDALRKARKALRLAGKHGEANDFHDLRKAVKAHAMHLSLLTNLWPKPIRGQRKAIEALGEKLGDLHDVFVMRAMLGENRERFGTKAETKLVDRLLRRSERKLRNACLAEASRLFSGGPKRPVKKLARKARQDLPRNRQPIGKQRAAP